jgi:hypothetical protein
MLLVMLLKSCAASATSATAAFIFHHDRNQIGWTGLNGVHKVAMSFPGPPNASK